MRTALLLIDVQREFMDKSGLTPAADDILHRITLWRQRAAQTGVPVIHVGVQTHGDPLAWPPHWRTVEKPPCIAGSAGAAFAAAPAAGEAVFAKQRYGAFDDAALEPALRDAGIDTLVLAGVNTHACVLATALEAEARGFRVHLAQGAYGSYDPDHHDASRAWLSTRIAPEMAIEDLGAGEGDGPIAALASGLSAAQPRLAAMPIAQRADRLRDWRDIVAANEATLIERLVCDVAKPVRDARGELAYALALIDHTISTLADEEPAAQGGPATRYRPLGCVAAITPWNNPLAMPVAKLAPALGYGNAVLLKPAPQGLAIAKLLHDWLGDTGMGDFVRVAPGDAQAGREAVSAVGIRAIAFTGSTRTGRAIIARGGALGRRVQAEMGGNNAAIIAPDADIAAAAADLVPAMFSFAGQRCTAVRRLIVANGIADAFESALQREMERLNMGDPACEDVQVGPVIDTAAASRLRQIRKEALARGGRIAAQARGDEADNFVLPTIIADCGPDDPLVMEEQFGPVCTIQRAADCDAAIALHNAVDQGLLGVLYSHDPRWRDAFAEEARAGMLSYNAARPAFAASGPFSGWGASGFGPPEHGRWNRDFQTRVQAIYDSESA